MVNRIVPPPLGAVQPPSGGTVVSHADIWNFCKFGKITISVLIYKIQVLSITKLILFFFASKTQWVITSQTWPVEAKKNAKFVYPKVRIFEVLLCKSTIFKFYFISKGSGDIYILYPWSKTKKKSTQIQFDLKKQFWRKKSNKISDKNQLLFVGSTIRKSQ